MEQVREIYLNGRPIKHYGFDFELDVTDGWMRKSIASIPIGSLRSGDSIYTTSTGLVIQYQDGTKWTINRSWYEFVPDEIEITL